MLTFAHYALDDVSAERAAAEQELAEIAPDLWRAGNLRWKLDPHQQVTYDAFCEWHARKQTPEYDAEMEAIAEEFDIALDQVWVDLISRRWGKTSKWILILDEFAIRLPMEVPDCRHGALLTYGTAYQSDIGDMIVPLANKLHADAPEDVRPTYHGSHEGGPAGLYYPNGSVVKLVGIDKHPNALRGRASDGIVIAEARDVRKLAGTVQSVLLPQFQRRPWAFLAIETSAPDDDNHDVMKIFVPDAKRRGAFAEQTIDDNTAIDPREKERAIRQAGGRDSVECQREYFNKIKRDENVVVVPEFNEELHVAEREVPKHAHAYVSADPGMRDLCALLWAVWDFEDAVLYVQRDWAKRGAGVSEIAGIVRKNERELWGTDHIWDPDPYSAINQGLKPPPGMVRVELHSEDDDAVDALRATLSELPGAPELAQTQDGRWWVPEGFAAFACERQGYVAHVFRTESEAQRRRKPLSPREEHPAFALTQRPIEMPEGLHYWSPDKQRFEQNPYKRVSDINPTMIGELRSQHGLVFANADKSVGARRELARQESAIHGVRTAFAAGQIIIDPSCKSTIMHLNGARWNEKRTDYERSELLGHADLLDALVYLWRAVNRKLNPFPPVAHGKDMSDAFIREEHKRRQQYEQGDRVALNEAMQLGGQRWRPNNGSRRWGR